MTIVAFICAGLLTFILGWLLGIWCGREATLDEIEKKETSKKHVAGESTTYQAWR